MVISLVSPLFFGMIISWILKPLVEKIKINRVVTTIFLYILIIGLIIFLIIRILPIMILEVKNIIPLFKRIVEKNTIINSIYRNLNIKKMLEGILKSVNYCINNIFSIVLNTIYSFIFGFYFLIRKNQVSYFKFIPKKLRININDNLRLYIKSLLIDTLFMFITFSILFYIIGLKSSILFAVLCAITNIIPYIGPYLGGIPAVIIGLSMNYKMGLLVLIIVIIVQMVENNIVQPLIVSKNVDLNPIYILIGLIVFGKIFGIIGMILSTPIIIVSKEIIKYYKKNKPNWLIQVLDKL